MSARLPWLDFNYRRPSSNFDDSQVKGVVAKLIRVKNHDHFTALDTVAGGKVREQRRIKKVFLTFFKASALIERQKDSPLVTALAEIKFVLVPTGTLEERTTLCDV